MTNVSFTRRSQAQMGGLAINQAKSWSLARSAQLTLPAPPSVKTKRTLSLSV
jgi:hypothetical protein